MIKIGSYNSKNIPLSSDDYEKLYFYLGDREVIIYFMSNKSYCHVRYVAVCMVRTETYDSYDLYQHDYISANQEDAISVIREIIEAELGL